MNYKNGRKDGQAENVKVFIRIRPFQLESSNSGKDFMSVNEKNECIYLTNSRYKDIEKAFKFHHVFPEETHQLEIYQHVAAPIVDTVLKGFNGTIFAYGQTGSGKTHTMVGQNSPKSNQGIIPNSFSHIFEHISKSANHKSFIVTASFLEIYNEEIRDLLTPDCTKKLTMHDHKVYGAYVKDLSAFTVNSLEEIIQLFDEGNKNRTTKSNSVNMNSSRSHAIFTISIESKEQFNNETTFGKLNFVDLAGSERIYRTNASGVMLKEATHINLSLSVLGNVISSLVDAKTTYIPYRNSKLTRLLQDSLGGNSKTAMVATISLDEMDWDESVCTLRYASRVKHIENFISINRKDEGLISSFEKQIQELQEKLQLLERKEAHKKELKLKSDEKRNIENELIIIESEKQKLNQRIDSIKQKIIIGGVNLLDKVEEQNCHLVQSSTELINLNSQNQILEEMLNEKNNERFELKEKYASLQEENEDLDEKIKLLQYEIKKYEQERKQRQTEQHFEIDRILEDKKAIMSDINLYNLVIDNYIPKQHLQKIESDIRYYEKADEFRIRNIAYAGNHVNREFIEEEYLGKPVVRKMRPPYIKQKRG